MLLEAIKSVRDQRHCDVEPIVVVDHNEALLRRLRSEVTDARIVENHLSVGASGARNSGASYVSTPYLAFLDDDAVADRNWLAKLVEPFADRDVVGTGGRVLPLWSSSRPAWFPPEFDWVVGASYEGMPAHDAPVRNVWAENMAVRRDIFEAVGGFRTGFGKLAGHSRPEDTDLCIRMAQAVNRGQWIYCYDATVGHHVPPERATYRFFLRRSYHEGRGKADLARLLPVGADALSSERDYVRHTLPTGVRHHLATSVRTGDLAAASRSASIVLGLGSTVWGFGMQKLADQLSRRDVVLLDASSPIDSARVA